MFLILLFIGAVFVYLLFFMAMLAGIAAFIISLFVYFLTYVSTYTWARIRHRKEPEWSFDKKPWTPNTDRFQEYAVVAGIASMVAMVSGFFAYAFSGGDWVTTLGIASCSIPFAWLVMKADTDEPSPDDRSFDRDKFSS